MIDRAADLCIGCGLALVFHFDRGNRKVSCEAARMAARLAFYDALREAQTQQLTLTAERPGPLRLIRGGKI